MAALHVHPHFNAEEAAAAAAEFVASEVRLAVFVADQAGLDNLPGEVTFLLSEIKEKDKRIDQLLSRINARHLGLTKSARQLAQGATPAAGPSTPSFPLPLPPGSPLPTAHLQAKDAQNLTKIQVEWGKIDDLQQEKIRLAERLERIVGRARERGRAEWKRVGGMDLDEVESERQLVDLGGPEIMLPPTGLGGDRQKSGWPSRAPSLLTPERKPAAIPLPQPPVSSITLSTSMPPPSSAPTRVSLSARPRGSRTDRHQSISTTMSDADADGEVEVSAQGAEGAADDGPYCFCQQASYGEMIGCDNPKCRFEWFHLKCVDMQAPLPDEWYCPDCVSKGSVNKASQKDKKGRKK